MSSQGNPPLKKRPRKARGPLAVSSGAGSRGSVLAWSLSGAAHVLVFAALFWPSVASPPVEPVAIPVTVVQSPEPDPPGPPGPVGPPGPPAAAPAAAAAAIVPAPRPAAPKSPPVTVHILAARAPTPEEDEHAVPDNSDILSDAQVAGAMGAGDGTSAGGGGGGNNGGGCDTAQIVQQALRKDPLVRSSVEDAHRLGKSVMLWNGDWVRSGIQEGKGLSAVREAIIWELAFTPEACRNKRVHGMVLLSLQDGSTRFAIGGGDWRWSDLLEVTR